MNILPDRLAASKPGRLAGLALGAVAALAAEGGYAFDFSRGDFWGSWDWTIGYGQSFRVESRDPALISTSAGGTRRSPNGDNGNLNYSNGTFSNAWTATTELELTFRNFGGFARASGLYDYEVENHDTDRTPLTDEARDLVGSSVDIIDAFIWFKFDIGANPAQIRVGKQVLSWGESTFIQGGINTINHFDVSKLRVPGAELRDAFLGQQMVWGSFGTSENTTLELFYQWDWDDTEPEAVGSYFATNDFVPDGFDPVFLGFGAVSDLGTDFSALGGPFIDDFRSVSRARSRLPDDDGQYGVAFRWFLPNLGNGTELGFYFINYHSRLPLINGRTGTQAGVANGAGAATAVGGAAQGLAAGLPFNEAVAAAAQVAVNTAAALGGNLSLATATQYATVGANTALTGGSAVAQAGAFAQHEYALTARYFTEFPEDIKLYGISFSTELGQTGVALQGEVSYRENAPLQFDDVEVLFAALSPLDSAIGSGALAAFGQLGGFGVNEVVRGWGEFDLYQAQTTATKIFGPTLGASQWVLLWEGAVTYADLPDKTTGGPNGRGLRFNGPATDVSGNDALAGAHFGEVEPLDRFADSTSWGYRLAARFDYLNLVGPWNVSPRVSWQHDVKGTSPGPGGNFVENRQALTLGIAGSYQAQWQVDLSYTIFNGAGRYNELGDRDFIAFNVKASF